MERTLSMIKPDAVEAGKAGEILARIEGAGFALVALRLRRLTRAQAEGFYHGFAGWMVFVVAMAMLAALSWVLTRLPPSGRPRLKSGSSGESPGQEAAP